VSSLTGRVFSYYHILDRIGQGGMGTVYRALDRKAGREVAIKFISPAIAQQEVFLNRFRREVKAVARLHHPHIVPVLDYGEQHGYAFLVMPLLEVGTLLDALKDGPLSLELGARVMDQVAGALAHAHRHGIIHRDVKPSNILLDHNQNAMLSDFGMARFHDASASLTGSGGLIGTPAYMAPEQARGGPVDARCDQYALGVVLFYLATGSLPFTAATPMEYLLKHINEPFPAARARNRRVPASVEQVILKATAKSPDDRFGSVSEMNHALQAAIAHARDPISHEAPTIELPAGAAPIARRPAPRKRRWPWRIAAAAAAGLLLILAVPVLASGLLGLLGPPSSPAEGSLPRMDPAQLTRQAITIAAMSTELAESHSDPDEIRTAVALTLTAAGPVVTSNGEGTWFDTLFGDGGSALPTASGLSGDAVLQTPSPTLAGLMQPSQTAAQSSGPGPTSPSNPLPPTQPPAQSATPVVTGQPAGPTATPDPTATPTSTPTPPSTPFPTSTPTSTATSTPPPTSPPTPTQIPTATNTQVPPPTATPTQNPCPLLDLGGPEVSGNAASWTLSNESPTAVVITQIMLDWPAANAALDRIRFGSSTIWNGLDDAPPSDISSGLIGSRSLAGGASRSLKFEFTGVPEPGGYSLQLQLDPGCQLSGGG
jgi:serine/threonine-protein kinase